MSATSTSYATVVSMESGVLKNVETYSMPTRRERGPMGSGMPFKAKCPICGQIRKVGTGGEASHCKVGSIQFYPKRLMCTQCRAVLAKAAIDAIILRVLIIKDKE